MMKPPHFRIDRRDADARHMEVYRESVERVQVEVFDAAFGNQQLSLAQLATHPRFFCQGAGTMLLRWGLSLADREGWTVTVFAGPMAESLYTRHGFQTLTVVKCQAEREDECIEFPAMVRRPSTLQNG